jgi:hypothetical protein
MGSILLSTALLAQQINGTVKDPQGKGVMNATVSLLNAKDSSVSKLALTKADGIFSIAGIKAGKYLLTTSHVGFNKTFSSLFDFDGATDVTIPVLQLEKSTGDMKGVTVTAKKPIVEVKADRTILNVEGTINATGTDALELLRKSPGVTVDKDDKLSLSGKNGVQVYIDGKPSPLTGTDLANYLKSTQSSQIESIELITNPSAKYEAAGNAGIINIRLKKNRAYGANGSVNAGWNIGTYAKYNSGISLNYRHKKTNLFGNYNYNNSLNENQFNLFRTTPSDSSFSQRSIMLNDNVSHGFKAGVDYYATTKSTFGIMANGNFSDNGFQNNGRTEIAYIPSRTIDRLLIANNTSESNRDNLNLNANYRFADTSGHELNIDADYGYYNSDSYQLQPNNIYDASGSNLKQNDTYRMFTPSEIDLYSTKVDYEQNFKKGRLGLGSKISLVQTDNTFQRYSGQSSSIGLEDTRNNFKYKENVNAVYVNYNRQFTKGVMIQAGLRVENTHSEGHSTGFRWDNTLNKMISVDSLIDRKYTDPFPSAAVTFNKNPMNQWGLTYSRRIDRPSYQDLNPFEFNLDKYTFQRGNPNLRPQYTNSFGITNTFKYRFTTTLNYSHVDDVFSMIPESEGTKALITNKNVAVQDIVSLNFSMPLQYKWYSIFANLNAFYSTFTPKTDLYKKVNVASFQIYAQQTFKLSKNTTAELSGFYSAPSVWQGAFKGKEMYGIDGGLQQTVLKGKGTLKASVTDIFKTMRWAGENKITGQVLNVNGRWESRQFRLNFSYRFGSNQVKQARQRKSSVEEENKRTQSSGGLGQ